ncbi:hypothetical protein PVAG01_08092 [Phlyctema vagabunda]|uniref:Indole-diterpene biosynthesis protein PaxU n=1 Tax=Phlyctema vagabunda TaxID=108571 RepID=A0ABR4P8I5_9HELO
MASVYGSTFAQLTPTVFYHEPLAPTTASSSDPDLILLAPWLNALPRHIAKYTTGYQALYPRSRILMITTSTVHMTVSSTASRQKRVQPILDLLCDLAPDSRVLVHFFSNGGADPIALLAHQYQLKTGSPLPAHKIVLDSTPGRATYSLSVRALSVALPKNFVGWLLGAFLIRVFLCYFFAADFVLQRENAIETIRKTLNKNELIPTSAERLYIYSKLDPIVDWHDVEEHIADAKAKGYVVAAERYEDSGHAGHLMKDEKRYWSAVRRTWEGK